MKVLGVSGLGLRIEKFGVQGLAFKALGFRVEDFGCAEILGWSGIFVFRGLWTQGSEDYVPPQFDALAGFRVPRGPSSKASSSLYIL